MADDSTQALAEVLAGEGARYCGPGYGTCGTVSVDWEHAQDLAGTVLAALPTLGWVRAEGAGEERTEWAQRSSPDAPHGTQPWWNEDMVRTGVRMWREAGKPDAQALRRTVRTVTTPDGWTHVSTGPWEVVP